MNGAGPDAHRGRSVWRWVLMGAFASSFLINPALASKKSVFEPNTSFRPICFTARNDLVILTGWMSREFRMAVLKFSRRAMGPGANGSGYITTDAIWNLTTRFAEDTYKKRTGKRLPKDRTKLGTNRCEFIRKYVLAAKISVFEPNYSFRPICHAGRHIGLVMLTGRATREFRKAVLKYSRQIMRAGLDGPGNISTETIWNMTSRFAEYTYEKRTGKRLSMDRTKTRSNKCEFIRKYVLEKPAAQ